MREKDEHGWGRRNYSVLQLGTETEARVEPEFTQRFVLLSGQMQKT